MLKVYLVKELGSQQDKKEEMSIACKIMVQSCEDPAKRRQICGPSAPEFWAGSRKIQFCFMGHPR